MILVTVGMQLGFDRLIQKMDEIAQDIDHHVIAQFGFGNFTPKHMEAHAKIAPDEFEALVERCDLIVSHAGIGTVLTAQRHRVPIVLFPRRFEHGEHRNDHQLSTVQKLQGRTGIFTALEDRDLRPTIIAALESAGSVPQGSKQPRALQDAIRDFIENGSI